jgi:hypothetical protein
VSKPAPDSTTPAASGVQVPRDSLPEHVVVVEGLAIDFLVNTVFTDAVGVFLPSKVEACE